MTGVFVAVGAGVLALAGLCSIGVGIFKNGVNDLLG